MKKIILFIVIIAMALSCKEEHIPAPAFGSLGGSVSPIGVVSTVYATDALGVRLSADVSAVTGNFSFGNLAAGAYTVSMPADSRFHGMGNIVVEVLVNRHTDLGTLNLDPIVQSSGAISGNVLPLGFGERVTATNLASGQHYTMDLSKTNGQFMIGLPNGDYRVSFTAVKPAEAPADVMVTVAGNLVNLGSIVCKQGNSGSIVAKVNPIGGVSTVKAINVSTGDVVLGAVNRSDGTISFPVMIAGNYKLTFSTYVPFLAPDAIEVTVLESKQTDLGTLSLLQDANVRMLGYSIDGKKAMRYDVSGSFIGGTLKFSQTIVHFISVIPERQTTEYATLTVTMENITGPGVYTFTGAIGSTITYGESRKSGITTTTVGNWSINGSTATGKLEILSIDPVARRIRGTFLGTLANQKAPALPASRTVTDGVFHLDY